MAKFKPYRNGNRNYAQNKGRRGHVYILQNRPNDFIYKIGHTTRRDVDIRVREINANGTYAGKPANYFCIHKKETLDCYTAEQMAHAYLDSFRVMRGYELFKFETHLELQHAKDVIHKICTEINGTILEPIIITPPPREYPKQEPFVRKETFYKQPPPRITIVAKLKIWWLTTKKVISITGRVLGYSFVFGVLSSIYLIGSSPDEVVISEDGKIENVIDVAREFLQKDWFWRVQIETISNEIQSIDKTIKNLSDELKPKTKAQFDNSELSELEIKIQMLRDEADRLQNEDFNKRLIEDFEDAKESLLKKKAIAEKNYSIALSRKK